MAGTNVQLILKRSAGLLHPSSSPVIVPIIIQAYTPLHSSYQPAGRPAAGPASWPVPRECTWATAPAGQQPGRYGAHRTCAGLQATVSAPLHCAAGTARPRATALQAIPAPAQRHATCICAATLCLGGPLHAAPYTAPHVSRRTASTTQPPTACTAPDISHCTASTHCTRLSLPHCLHRYRTRAGSLVLDCLHLHRACCISLTDPVRRYGLPPVGARSNGAWAKGRRSQPQVDVSGSEAVGFDIQVV